jgi:hydrogenase maturation factor
MSACAPEPDGHCTTCGDIAIAMVVRELRGPSAICVDEHGVRHEVAIDLIGPLARGDEVLVHAGVAIG